MLVLSRKTSERIHVGDDVTITVVRVGPDNVRLGIDAPGKRILREELVTEQVSRDEGNRELSLTR